MSAALQMYQQGSSVLQEKETEIVQFSKTIEMEIMDAYKDERRKVIQKINDMEGSPRLYHHLLAKHGLFPTFTKKLQVSEYMKYYIHSNKQTSIKKYIH